MIFLGLWLTRNVFISGYLVYPLVAIDWFDVDWKVPNLVAKIQNDYVLNYAYYSFVNDYRLFKSGWLGMVNLGYPFFYLCPLIFPLIYLFFHIKKQKELLKGACILGFAYLYLIYSSPNMRFVLLYTLGLLVIGLMLLLTVLAKYINYKVLYSVCVLSFMGLFVYSSCQYFTDFEGQSFNYELQPTLSEDSFRQPPKEDIEIVKYNNYSFSVIKKDQGTFAYECFPLATYSGYPAETHSDNPAFGNKIQHLKAIESKGPSITDGFKTQPEWNDFFERNETYLMSEYKRILGERLGIVPR